MKFSKLFVWAIAATAMFAACSDDNEYTYAPLHTDTLTVFIPEQDNKFTFGNDDEVAVPVTLFRNATESELTVPLTHKFTNGGVKEAPQSVTFKKGENKATVVYKFVSDSIKGFINYALEVKVAEGAYNPYKQTPGFFSYVFNVVKEDYEMKALGQMNDEMAGPRNVVLEASPTAPYHRISGAWGEGTGDIVFTINKDNTLTLTQETIATGLSHPKYGAITATVKPGSKYDPATKTYYFMFEYTVAAGSFGEYVCTFK